MTHVITCNMDNVSRVRFLFQPHEFLVDCLTDRCASTWPQWVNVVHRTQKWQHICLLALTLFTHTHALSAPRVHAVGRPRTESGGRYRSQTSSGFARSAPFALVCITWLLRLQTFCQGQRISGTTLTDSGGLDPAELNLSSVVHSTLVSSCSGGLFLPYFYMDI